MINIYKVPGVFIVGFHGAFGTGKTLGLVEQGIKMAAMFDLTLVSSFPINQYWLNKYCEHKKYKKMRWKIIDLDNLDLEIESESLRFSENWKKEYRREGLTPLLYLLAQKKSVILLDEAGLKLFARNFKNVDNRIFDEMFQLRKNTSFLFYSCQYLEQIDKQLRDNTHLWIYCKGFQVFSKQLKHHVLIKRSVIAFSQEQFKLFMAKPELQNKTIYPLMLSGWRFSSNHLVLNKILGTLNHLRKALKEAHIKSKGKGLTRIFWELHYIEEYFKKVEFISDEDLLFKIYDSFGKVGSIKKRRKLIKFINSTLTREIKECPQCEYKGDEFAKKVIKTGNRQTFETTCLKCGYFWKTQLTNDLPESNGKTTITTTSQLGDFTF